MPFDPPDIETDEDAVTDRLLAGMAERMEGWEAIEAAPEVALAEELGREIAVLNQTTIEVLNLAIAGIGETAFGFPAFDGVAAQIEVDITLNQAGTIVPSGFTVVGVNDNGDEVAFELAADMGAAETTVHATLTAIESGNIGNGVPAGPLTVLTATSNVVDVTATAASTNGADPESIDVYLDRLVDYLNTLRPGGVRAEDLAALARSVPGVYRAIGADLFDPANPGVPAERTATVFVVDDTGHPVTEAASAQLQQVLEDAREVNFVIHVEPPDYTPVHIVFTAIAEAGYDPAQVEVEVRAALVDWLTQWGITAADEQAWVSKPAVRLLEASQVAGSVEGLAYLTELTINGAAADYALPGGIAAYPTPFDDAVAPSTVTGTVTA